AMALYPGETLKARLDREGPLPVGDALAIARQIAEGLANAHAAGIVHRDLKPGNVMLAPNGPVKILDFGLAKARDQSLSTASARWGTVAYMAPGQIRGEAGDPRGIGCSFGADTLARCQTHPLWETAVDRRRRRGRTHRRRTAGSRTPSGAAWGPGWRGGLARRGTAIREPDGGHRARSLGHG